MENVTRRRRAYIMSILVMCSVFIVVCFGCGKKYSKEEEDACQRIKGLGGVAYSATESGRLVWTIDLSRSDSVTDDDIVHISTFRHVTSVDLSRTRISNHALKQLHGMSELRSLNVCFTAIGDAANDTIESFSNLEELNLMHTKITNNSMISIGKLRRLRILILEGNDITDSGLVGLRDMPELTALWLNETNITDHGLQHLEKLDNLRRLFVDKTRVTQEGIRILRSKLPMLSDTKPQ